MTTQQIETLLENALELRTELLDARHETAFRLYNGFTEGNPALVVDLYAKTLVIHNYADKPELGLEAVNAAQQFLPNLLPWIQAIVVKTRNSQGFSGFQKKISRCVQRLGDIVCHVH